MSSIPLEEFNIHKFATKQDVLLEIERLRHETEKLRSELSQNIEKQRADTNVNVVSLQKDIEQIRKEIEQIRQDLKLGLANCHKDIEELRKETVQIRTDLTLKIEELRIDSNEKIEKLRIDSNEKIESLRKETILLKDIIYAETTKTRAEIAETNLKIEKMRSEISNLFSKQLKWIIGLLTSFITAILITLAKCFNLF